MKKIIILPIEPIESRYSGEWFKYVPQQLRTYAERQKKAVEVIQLEVPEVPKSTTAGAFLDFAGTNVYKSSQLIELAKMIQAGKVRDGDVILITDAWNPCVLQIRYMLDLLKIKAQIHGVWHAGSYDPTDILGFTIQDKRWSHGTERAMYYAYDMNYFASQYHIDMFLNTLRIYESEFSVRRNKLVGWPMEYLKDPEVYPIDRSIKKEKIVLFPHRLSPDKQPELFIELRSIFAELAPDYKFIMTQGLKLDKKEYHALLSRTEIILSMNLHEMLGISMYEGMMHGAIPIMPTRLSYKEMYDPNLLYNSEWTSGPENFQKHKTEFINYLLRVMTHKESFYSITRHSAPQVDKFFNGDELYKSLLGK